MKSENGKQCVLRKKKKKSRPKMAKMLQHPKFEVALASWISNQATGKSREQKPPSMGMKCSVGTYISIMGKTALPCRSTILRPFFSCPLLSSPVLFSPPPPPLLLSSPLHLPAAHIQDRTNNIGD